MNIDLDILETVGAYMEGILEKGKADEVRKLLKSDQIYQQHLEIYHSIVKGIEMATNNEQKKTLASYHHTETNQEEEAIIANLIKGDKRTARYRTFRNITSIAAAIILTLFLGNVIRNYINTAPNGVEDRIAKGNDQEDDILLGSSGTEIVSISYRLVELSNEDVNILNREERNVELIEYEQPLSSYLIDQEELKIFSNAIEPWKETPMEWLEIKEEKPKYYLKVQETYFQLKPSDDLQVFGASAEIPDFSNF